MKKRVLSIILPILFACCIHIWAASDSTYRNWSDPDEPFSPYMGTLTCLYYDDYVRTTLTFKYSEESIEVIDSYNSTNVFAGMDIKAVRNSASSYDMMDAYDSYTSLPDPVEDLEDNGYPDATGRKDEADVVALGALQAERTYTFGVYWDDYRSGASSHNGDWYVNSEISQQFLGIGDYNTDEYETLVRLEYGNTAGLR